MPRFQDTRLISKPRALLFEVVADVRRYPDFLPWCVGARVYGERDGQFDADLLVGYKMFRERFSSRVTYDQGNWVRATYRRGPLRHLNCIWSFADAEDGTQIDFDVDFQFANATFDKLIKDRFADATDRMSKAFEARAGTLVMQRSGPLV